MAATANASEASSSTPPAAAGVNPTPDGTAKAPANPIARHKQTQSLKKKTKAQPPVIHQTKQKAENIAEELGDELPERLETEIKKYFGLRYKMGGSGKNGIDCSTLTRKVYADVFGIDLPGNSTQQSRAAMLDQVADDNLQTGDLLFFGPKRKRVNHVGIYLAGGYFLHAARSEGVTISRLDNHYWRSRWMLSRRIRDIPDDRALVGGQELNRVLEQFSMGLAFAEDTDPKRISFLDSGILVNDTSELRLSASYKQTLYPSLLQHPGRMPLSLRQPVYPLESESRLRLSAVLSPLPLEGFKLVPSITQIFDHSLKADATMETQTLGLETWMMLPSTGIAFFLGAQAKNREDLLQRPLKMTPDWRTLDFSMGLHYRFSDALRFSLLGTHSYSAKIDIDTKPRYLPTLLDDISFKLDYRF